MELIIIIVAGVLTLASGLYVFFILMKGEKLGKRFGCSLTGSFVVLVFALLFGAVILSIVERPARNQLQQELMLQVSYSLQHFIEDEFDGSVPHEMWYLTQTNFPSVRLTIDFYRILYVWIGVNDLDFSINDARRAINQNYFSISPFLALPPR
ncbi:MAG: hypothetical protein FWB96_00860 [Defluviitaleaceae bacterium]|nr:hypothetical protein [Defluviitaleaceae bacterium]MCL2262758.1 hypothetical protein [Defluviitaleaceae bacterium]